MIGSGLECGAMGIQDVGGLATTARISNKQYRELKLMASNLEYILHDSTGITY